ncbi:hypothetical protein [Gordonia desulfuricans]|uniref:hypothetical protein n=1 Tax=Gordonia desulfuricans TaxID=89051 RepID=UPI001EE468C2|nr:hypothetical protein [Gordonia desulfuricans]
MTTTDTTTITGTDVTGTAAEDTAAENTGRKGLRSRKGRLLAVLAGVGVAGALAAGGAGLASAGTLPVGQATTAMTITNHTDKTQYLTSADPGAGHWINAPRGTLAPGASEIVTASTHGNHETVTINYRIGAVGPHAVYQLVNVPGGTNTNATGVTGGHYWINANVSTGFPHANAGYDLW